MITKSQEEYLKNMYLLSKQDGDLRVTDIAKKMGYSKPSVTKQLQNLKSQGLINYETYGEITLTPEGENVAKKVLAAYDIFYVFLHDVIGIDEEKSKSEAEKMKSVLEDDTINEIVKYIHKALGLDNLICNYNIAKEQCRNCKRSKIEKK